MSITTAAPLLAFIRKTETGFSDWRAYETMYGHKKITPTLTLLTLGEAIRDGAGWTRRHKSSAAGAYQFMNATLKDLKASERLTGGEFMTPAFQDRLGYALLKRRGFEQFMDGELSTVEFGKNLAREWASFPVLRDTQGAHRLVKRGQSYYVGDGLNKALIKPEQVEAILADLRAPVAAPLPDAPMPTPAPVPAPRPTPRREYHPAFEPEESPIIGVMLSVAVMMAMAFVIWFVFFKR